MKKSINHISEDQHSHARAKDGYNLDLEDHVFWAIFIFKIGVGYDFFLHYMSTG